MISFTTSHTIRRHRVDTTWRSQRWQHAMKPYIGSESRFQPTPPALDATVRGSVSEYRHDVWGGKNLEWCGYPMVKKLKICLFALTEFTNVTDRQTDGRTPDAAKSPFVVFVANSITRTCRGLVVDFRARHANELNMSSSLDKSVVFVASYTRPTPTCRRLLRDKSETSRRLLSRGSSCNVIWA